ncbi:MAG TPA: 23S rRNA (adenine(2503)-C(2))-methyltransferase RlmN [Terracidiphilus sp.]|nr:23S rRNA (adenine(2503)-C(2))-methyltransferase RlmN [Terracidiphilus sp.]
MSDDSIQNVPLEAAGLACGSQETSEFRRLFGLDAEALAACMVAAGEPAWRGRQLAEALYRQRVTELDAITTLPKALRQRLVAEGWQVGRPRITQVFQSADGTERYLVECQGGDGLTVEAGVPGSQGPQEAVFASWGGGDRSIVAGVVETVWMPEGDDGESGDGSDSESPQTQGAPSFPCSSAERVGNGEPQSATIRDKKSQSRQCATLCISSQVGCAVNCRFCFTAQLGFQRNLTAGEIAGQVVAVFDRHAVEVGRDRVNLVFMGMGEPFLNYSNFMGAVRLLVREVGLSPQRMTVSTSGIVSGIERFAQEPVEFRPKLAISLNAPNDRIRSELMPINRKWTIQAVMDAVRRIKLRPRERITFEYVLLGGVTDWHEDAAEVARLIRRTGLPAKVNLIAWNPGPGISYATPQPEALEAFRNTLIDAGIPAYIRKPRGRDIHAACGQLKRTVEG